MQDITTFETFFKENYSDLVNLAFSYLRDQEESRDVVSDSMEYLWENKDGLKAERWRGFICWHVRNRCIDNIRHRQAEDRFLHLQQLMSQQYSYDEDKEKRILQVMAELENLPTRTRAILTSVFMERKKYREVAREQGISITAVKKHISKAMRLFKEKIVNNQQ